MSTEEYEAAAEQFHRDTGHMAPGKDVAAMGGGASYDVRIEAWNVWVTMKAKIAKLQAFKDYVHMRLDQACVPEDPEAAENAKHGCRIEGRLNWALSIAATDARVLALKALLLEAADGIYHEEGSGLADRLRAAGAS